jgi:mono/diheme cytochrome c family protein
MLLAGVALLFSGCDRQAPRPTDAELHLSAQESAGRRVYDTYCLGCHEAYISGGRRGPSLQGVFKKPELPSGTPANDERISDVVMNGRAKMPAFSNRITQDQLKDLLAYMHTL